MEHLSTKKTVVDKWRFYADISEDGCSDNAELTIIYEVEDKRMTGFVELSDQMIADFDIPVTQEHSETVASYVQKIICITESKTYENVRDWANTIRARLETVELIFEDFWDDEKDGDGWIVECEDHTMKGKPKFDGVKWMKDHGCSNKDIFTLLCGDEMLVEKSNKFSLGDVVHVDDKNGGKTATIIAIHYDDVDDEYEIGICLNEAADAMWVRESCLSMVQNNGDDQKFNGIQWMKDFGCTDEDINNILCGDENFVDKSNKFKLGDTVKIDQSFFRNYGKLAVVVAIDWQKNCETYNIAVRLESGEWMWIQEGDCVKIEEEKTFDGIQWMKNFGCTDEDIDHLLVGEENLVEKSDKFSLGDVVYTTNPMYSCFDDEQGTVVAIDWVKEKNGYDVAVFFHKLNEVEWVDQREFEKVKENKNV